MIVLLSRIRLGIVTMTAESLKTVHEFSGYVEHM